MIPAACATGFGHVIVDMAVHSSERSIPPSQFINRHYM